MKFRIFQPAKSAMQSGKKNTQKWLMLPILEENIRFANEITGWISAKNTNSQFNFEFSNKEDAIEFAKKSGFEFEIIEPKTATIKKKSYAANFTN